MFGQRLARGDYYKATTPRHLEILEFQHFARHTQFVGEGEKSRNKVLKRSITVKVVIDLDCGNTMK